jgi:hypothetical protein
MEHFDSNDDNILTALFPDGDYSSIFENDVQFSDGNLNHDDFFYPTKLLDVELNLDALNQPFHSNNNGHDFTNDTEGYEPPLELNHFLTGLFFQLFLTSITLYFYDRYTG